MKDKDLKKIDFGETSLDAFTKILQESDPEAPYPTDRTPARQIALMEAELKGVLAPHYKN